MVITKISVAKDLPYQATYLGVAELLRKGGSSASALPTLGVPASGPGGEKPVIITKQDVAYALRQTVGHDNVRILAEAMAPTILALNLSLYAKNPSFDLRGDLANKINKKLLKNNSDSLTPLERIGCNTFMQWMGNLDQLTQSSRLKALLEAYLSERNRPLKKKSKKKKIHNRYSKNSLLC